jgi:hypothetical protein
MYGLRRILDVFRHFQHHHSVGYLGDPYSGDQDAPTADTTETLADASISAWISVSAPSSCVCERVADVAD